MTHALMSRADKPYGDVEYADPGYQSDKKPRYPIDTEDHCRAAWAYINKPDNAGMYTPSQLANVKQRIRQAADKFGIDLSADEPGRAAFLDLFGADVFARWTDSEHPHAPAGSSTGGEFVTAGSGGTAAKPQAKKKGHPAPAAKHQAAKKPAAHTSSGNLAYNPHGNHGTGYGTAGGDSRVHQLQRDLTRLGITDAHDRGLKDDGKLGPHTTAAVKKLQKALGLKQDGVVTPALLAQIHGLKALPAKRSALLDVCTRDFGFEFDERSKGDGRTLEGYAAVFNKPARIRDIGGDFEEVIRPGAFKRSLATRMPILQWDHGKDPRVGTVPIGSIQHLAEDSQGLHVRARLFDNAVVEPVRQAIEARAVKGMSFRFGVAQDGEQWTRRSGDIDLRDLTDLDTHELGPVAFPAYDHTSVSVRSMLAGLRPDEHRSLVREFATFFNVPILRAESEDYGDPGTLAQAVDVALDQAIASMPTDGMSPDVQKAVAFLTAADAAMDSLLAAMGVEDLPDPPARSRPTYLTGRSVEWIDDGGDPGAEPEPSTTRQPHLRQRLDEGALRARGILK